jgi:hypothetical protein
MVKPNHRRAKNENTAAVETSNTKTNEHTTTPRRTSRFGTIQTNPQNLDKLQEEKQLKNKSQRRRRSTVNNPCWGSWW